MLKIIWIILLLQSSLFSLELDNKTTFNELLSHTEIYEDSNNSENISTIKDKKFKENNEEVLPYGYAPKYTIWIKFTLTNSTDKSIDKIIEYNNPLTSSVNFFENGKLKKKDGLLHFSKNQNSLNPILKITLKPHQSKEYFIQASSKITTLIVKLNVWSPEAFEKKERNHQIILALFFGAIFIMILYNSTISILTKEKDYIYYVLFVMGVSFHHFIYVGAIKLYFSSELMQVLINYFSFIVSVPTLFLALYTQNILSLKEHYPKHNKIYYYFLAFYLISTIIINITGMYNYRSLAFIIFILFLFYLLCYAFSKKDKKAYYHISGWILFVISAVLMYLSSSGRYDIFTSCPYLIEVSLILEIIAFSFTLSSKINRLKAERLIANERKLAYVESEHRFKNTIQLILSFITFQKDKIDDNKVNEMFTSLERRIMATAHLHSQLHINNTHEFFSSILDNIKESFKQDDIEINIDCSTDIPQKDIKPCAQIIFEAIMNSYKYAFNDMANGKIKINLYEKKKYYYLKIEDNGSGFSNKKIDGLGIETIETLAILQLEGELSISNHNGVTIKIKWEKI